MPATTLVFDEIERRFNIGRRDFLTFCAAITATMGLPREAAAEVAEAITKKDRPSVIWLHHQECTGCTRVTPARRAPHTREADPRHHLSRLP